MAHKQRIILDEEEAEFSFRTALDDIDDDDDTEEKEWDESLHPRDDHGRFGAGGGSSDAKERPIADGSSNYGITPNKPMPSGSHIVTITKVDWDVKPIDAAPWHGGSSKTYNMEVLVNPTYSDVRRLTQDAKNQEIRVFHDDVGNLYAWDAHEAVHQQVIESLDPTNRGTTDWVPVDHTDAWGIDEGKVVSLVQQGGDRVTIPKDWVSVGRDNAKQAAKKLWDEFKHFLEVKDWDESKHPRDPGGEGGGQFTSTGGGGDGGGDTDEYGLAPRERQALADWMGSGYRDLRTDPNFAKVLDKLPTVTGMYFRGTRMTDEQLATFQNGVGRVTGFDKHSSSSQRRGSAMEFMESQRHSAEKRNPVLFEIAGTGQRIPRPLAQEAGATDETEVVIPMGGRYKVDGVEKVTDDDVGVYYKIKMSKV